jgi:hypothetical protein
MSDYDDYLKDQEQWAKDLDELAKIREAAEWERRLKALMARTGRSRKTVLSTRSRLIQNAMKLRPDLSESQATAWVDSVVGLDPAN